ncbi:MAG: hypothetical protein HQ558_00750 [Candidatus Omnitrophica bacterium]|nr:hypothetical protein [Candidatus Omnitrophota bacterium]
METSVFIAKIFGLCYLVIAVGLLLNQKLFRQIMEDFIKSAAGVFYGGVLALVVGVVIILTHNVWVANWTVMITIIGWIGFIKGIWLIVFPGSVNKFMQAYLKNEKLLVVQALGALVFGLVLTYFGFFAG